MQKRQNLSKQHRSFNPQASTISGKLFSLTGLRVFQAKFMEELHEKHSNIKIKKPEQLKLKQSSSELKTILKKQNVAPQIWHGKLTPIEKIPKKKMDKMTIKQVRYCQPRGLHNIGNTCYMNSVLQILFHLPRFNNALLEEAEQKTYQKHSVTGAYLNLLKEIMDPNQHLTITPSQLKSNIGKKKNRFYGSAQQDAQELLTAMLEVINEETTRLKEKPTYKELEGDPLKQSLLQISNQWWQYSKTRDDSIICDFFQGQLLSTVTCKKCSTKSINFDNVWGIPVTLKRKCSNLNDLLAFSLGSETQIADYYCLKCQKLQNCSKIFEFFRLPEVLVLQLKRFDFGKWKKEKINEEVKAEIEIDMRQYLNTEVKQEKTKYKLCGMVNHYGGVDFGHYLAKVLNQKNNEWLEMNDSKVTPADSAPSKNAEVYLLFYERL